MATARCIFRTKVLGYFCSRLLKSRGICSSISSYRGDVLPMWDDPNVIRTLKQIRGLELDKVYKFRQQDQPEVPQYKVMTDQEVLEAQKEAERKAEEYLQMPLQLTERKEIEEVISVDKHYVGFDESKYIFTDISSSTTDETRRIVVREPNGTLRQARWEERERMNQIYNPKDGKKFYLPPMLQDEHIGVVFDQLRHEDVLDLVCLQCEPDSAECIKIHEKTYKDIVLRNEFGVLRSTRHFGGFAFYLARQQNIDGLLVHMLAKNRVNDAVALVRLYHFLNKESPMSESAWDENLNGEDLLKAYLEERALSRGLHLFKNLVENQEGDEEEAS